MMKAGGMEIGTSRGPSRALAQGLTPDSGPNALHFWYHQKQLAEYIKNLADETVETGVWDKFKRHVKMKGRDGVKLTQQIRLRTMSAPSWNRHLAAKQSRRESTSKAISHKTQPSLSLSLEQTTTTTAERPPGLRQHAPCCVSGRTSSPLVSLNLHPAGGACGLAVTFVFTEAARPAARSL